MDNPGHPGGSDGKASACNVGDLGSIPGLERSPGEGNDNPLQYSCLENPMDGGAWQATVHGVAKSRTRLSRFTLLLSLIQWIREMSKQGIMITGVIPPSSSFSQEELPWRGAQVFLLDWTVIKRHSNDSWLFSTVVETSQVGRTSFAAIRNVYKQVRTYLVRLFINEMKNLGITRNPGYQEIQGQLTHWVGHTSW